MDKVVYKVTYKMWSYFIASSSMKEAHSYARRALSLMHGISEHEDFSIDVADNNELIEHQTVFPGIVIDIDAEPEWFEKRI